jgi:integrase
MGVRVRERPKGSGIWWIFINHKGKRKAKKIGKDKRLARDVAKKIEAKLTLGEIGIEQINSKCPTFKEYAESWLSLPNDRKESTNLDYAMNLQRHVYSCFGDVRVDRIRRKDIKLLFDGLLSKGMQPTSFYSIKTPIRAILRHAVDSELIDTNPMNDLKFKHKVRYVVDPLTEAEAFSLLDQGRDYESGLYYPPILCALRTGMRLGELQGLKWADLDFEKRLINVDKSWRHGKITSTKNRRIRKVDVSRHLAETLRALKKTQWMKYAKATEPVPQWVFARSSSDVLSSAALRKALNVCLEKAGIRRIRIHDLRHSYATIRLLKGHNIGDVSYQLGHSSISITYDVYGHWMPGKFKSQVDELDMQPNATETQPKKKLRENQQGS